MMRTRRSGQALVVGVTVMFILLAVGLLFLRLALNHLGSTNVSSERTDDLNLSRAGIDYVDHELMTSALGADWRPQPRNLNPGFIPAGGNSRVYLKQANGAALPPDPALAALDPDFLYLRPWAPTNAPQEKMGVYKGQDFYRSPCGPTGGFTRLNFGKGRVLVRVSYNPRNAFLFNGADLGIPLAADLPGGAAPVVAWPSGPSGPSGWSGQSWINYIASNSNFITRGPWTECGPTPTSQYIRIETIGRLGNTQQIDNTVPAYTDPTVLEDAGLSRPYRVSMIAYKSFGLGDHLLFLTNNNKETGPFDIGSTAGGTFFNQTPGRVAGDLGGEEIAGDLRINGDARFFNSVVLDDSIDAHQIDPNSPNNPLAPPNYPNPFMTPGYGRQFPSPRPVLGGVNVAGQISAFLDPTTNAYAGVFLSDYNAFWAARTTGATPAGELFPDDLVKDNAWFDSDSASTARTVRRLPAPSQDLDRFRSLAPAGNGQGLLAADLGGPGLRIDNSTDMQPTIADSDVHNQQGIDFAPQSWYSPYEPPAADKASWPNPGYIYAPPGVRMTFHHPVTAPSTDPDPLHFRHYYIRLYTPNGSWPWIDHSSSNSAYLDVYYTPDALTDQDVRTAAAQIGRTVTDPATGRPVPAPVALVSDNTIMAEGNLSIHGDVAPGMTSGWPAGSGGAQLTVVSRGTIYIDGDLTRAEQATGTPQDINNYQTYVNGSMQPMGVLQVPSAVVLMAQDHVAVNMTQSGSRVQHWNYQYSQEFQPDDDIPATQDDFATDGGPPPARHWTFDSNGGQGTTPRFFRITFSLSGVPQGAPVRMYLRHASRLVNGPPGQNTEVDAYLNPPEPTPNVFPLYTAWGQYRILKNGAGTLPVEQQSITPLLMSPEGQSQWEYASYRLDQQGRGTTLKYGGDNYIDIEVPSGTYFLSRVEIRAEAEVSGGYVNVPESRIDLDGAFAAGQGSFYLIPKDWFYFDPAPNTVAQRRHSDLPMASPPVDYSSGNAGGWGIDFSYPGYVPSSGANPSPQSPSPPYPFLEQVVLDGSLTVNTMAPQVDQAQWTLYDPSPLSVGDPNAAVFSQLRYVYPFYYSWYPQSAPFPPDGGGTPSPPNGTPPTTNGGPLYAYNDGLQDLTLRDGSWLPIMPRLPLSPGLAYEGEGLVI